VPGEGKDDAAPTAGSRPVKTLPRPTFEPVDSFDALELKEPLLRGIYAYGFENPSAIQQVRVRCEWLEVLLLCRIDRCPPLREDGDAALFSTRCHV
jgi:hypothetical protein